ncbi:hypothetical protein TNCV_1565971 [Trichonephila clavipes]|nr:hypothetical protein TNCV_1565971 [Trichonephila clavipes]
MESSSGQLFIPTYLGRVDEEMIPQDREPSSPSLATYRSLLLPAAVSSFTIPPPPSEKVLLVKPPEPNAGSSTTRNKITSFLLSKNLPFRITRIKNINYGGIAICLTTDEDVIKLSQELSNNDDFASFSISNPIRRKPQFILFAGDFNARSVVWWYKNTDRRGDILTDFTLQQFASLQYSRTGTNLHGPRSMVGNPDLSPHILQPNLLC